MNLSAPFLSQFYKDNMDAASPYWDIIFGNESEAVAYSESHDFGITDIKEIALKVAALHKKNNRPRLVVFTQGKESTIVVENGKVREFPVLPIDPEEINDTNGAGDAFVGGFLSEYVKGSPVSNVSKLVIGWLALLYAKLVPFILKASSILKVLQCICPD
ncbi:adenosine kinase [Massospora cicadina]|nr:adenosine kinase [Massospora cicadina]